MEVTTLDLLEELRISLKKSDLHISADLDDIIATEIL